ncbi:MAG: hypothetical protein LBG67_05235 [Campylobacteraceae bacterium]|nr:hypothetical protein [Campylobacteraceae bacterium]
MGLTNFKCEKCGNEVKKTNGLSSLFSVKNSIAVACENCSTKYKTPLFTKLFILDVFLLIFLCNCLIIALVFVFKKEPIPNINDFYRMLSVLGFILAIIVCVVIRNIILLFLPLKVELEDKEHKEKPIFEVKKRSVFCIVIFLFWNLFFTLIGNIMSVLALLSIFKIRSHEMPIASFVILLGVGCLYHYMGVLIDILSFKKIAIYEDYILIERRFLFMKDVKIKISDIISINTISGGAYSINSWKRIVTTNKNFYVHDVNDDDKIVEILKRERGTDIIFS